MNGSAYCTAYSSEHAFPTEIIQLVLVNELTAVDHLTGHLVDSLDY